MKGHNEPDNILQPSTHLTPSHLVNEGNNLLRNVFDADDVTNDTADLLGCQARELHTAKRQNYHCRKPDDNPPECSYNII